ncbi:hypothetical protein MAQA_01657 [Listeria aquatica FSL S10-1188]|nr:hypothetical protein MAQA_01657 [Listeria aquatica FSL S10-1188]
MGDIIVDILGALVIAIIGYIALKKGLPWMKQFTFKRKNWKKTK